MEGSRLSLVYCISCGWLILLFILAHFVEESIDEVTGLKRLDGWPVGTKWRYPQPKSLEKRLEHAAEFRFAWPIGVDVSF